MGVDKVLSLFAIKNRNLTNEKRNGNDATCVCVPYSFQNYGSICCFGFPLNKIDEEMGEVEPTAQHNHPKTKLRRGINIITTACSQIINYFVETLMVRSQV